MVPALVLALALASGHASARDAQIRERKAFAARVRTTIERGDVEAFIALLSPNGIRMGDGIIATTEVAAEIRKKRGVYADIFDTSARRVSAGSPDVLSYRDFFRRAKDAVVTVDLEFNRIWWRSESLRDIGSAAGQPHFGVEEVGGRLRIGCFDGGCD